MSMNGLDRMGIEDGNVNKYNYLTRNNPEMPASPFCGLQMTLDHSIQQKRTNFHPLIFWGIVLGHLYITSN
jgi:hypothetical protein